MRGPGGGRSPPRRSATSGSCRAVVVCLVRRGGGSRRVPAWNGNGEDTIWQHLRRHVRRSVPGQRKAPQRPGSPGCHELQRSSGRCRTSDGFSELPGNPATCPAELGLRRPSGAFWTRFARISVVRFRTLPSTLNGLNSVRETFGLMREAGFAEDAAARPGSQRAPARHPPATPAQRQGSHRKGSCASRPARAPGRSAPRGHPHQ